MKNKHGVEFTEEEMKEAIRLTEVAKDRLEKIVKAYEGGYKLINEEKKIGEGMVIDSNSDYKMSYKAFEATIEALKEENRVNIAELQKNHLEGKIERSSWTVKKMILDQEKRCIEQIEALYLSRSDDSAFKHYLEYEHEHHYKIWKESDDNMRYACLVVYEKCLEAFGKAYEMTKERP